VKKFPAFPFLYDTFQAIQSGRHLHILKSRQMLATTLCCAYFLWCLLFRDGWTGLMLSRKDDLVDDGGQFATWNSLFGRVLFMHSRLPAHLRHRLVIRANRISNPMRNSFIVGESGNVKDSGRGGVFSSVLMDEAAKIPRSETVFSAIRDATSQVIMNSTPAGKQGVFYRLYKSGTTFTKLLLHWSAHPGRDTTWYDNERRDRTPENVAEELDCSFELSVQGRCIPEFDSAKHVRDDAVYSPDYGICAGWDFGIGDATAVVFGQMQGRMMVMPGSYQRSDLTTEQFSPLAVGALKHIGCETPLQGVRCFVDGPTGARRNSQTARTDIEDYGRFGWRMQPIYTNEYTRIKLWRRLCTTDRIAVHPSNADLIDCLEQLHFPTNDQGVVITDQHSDPKAHGYSHMPDAGGYMLVGLERVGVAAMPQNLRIA